MRGGEEGRQKRDSEEKKARARNTEPVTSLLPSLTGVITFFIFLSYWVIGYGSIT